MRLQHIKLAGFKSFVDPTIVPFPSNLVAVVGPNGCGKSNIIDAVRWVMGESSAKQLRGESIVDVIFNGSTSRKPAGQASIELHFDNSLGKLGGQYASYSEIVIRRQVNLDGQSSYYLNGTHCRRRDITDLFLGTGLGPRSYSIIEQGMISRLIEAKPEDLRVYLEEAAGISKYKERRHETELRISHTVDNLSRLTDIRDELQRQLDHLQKQAQAAEKFQNLKTEERLLKAQLLTLRVKNLQQQWQEQETQIREQSLHLEALQTQLQSLETQREQQQILHTDCNDQLQEVQKEYYQLNTELARVEQNLENHKTRKQQLTQDLAQATQLALEARAQCDAEVLRAEELQRQLAPMQPQVDAAKMDAQTLQEKLQQDESVLSQWQAQWDTFNQSASQTSQEAQVSQTQIQHVEQLLLSLKQRLERLQAETHTQQQLMLHDVLSPLQEKQQAIQLSIDDVQQKLTNVQQQIQLQRDVHQQLSQQLDQSRRELQSLRGRHASLTALQEAALGKTDEGLKHWLVKQHLGDKPRLAQEVNVESGWETAAETVLGDYLEAVCLPQIQAITSTLQELTHGTFTAIEISSADASLSSQHDLTSLLSKVHSPYSLAHLLKGIYVAHDLADAFSKLDHLRAHESIITADGIWLGKGWLRVSRGVDQKAGVLQRERELQQLQQDSQQQEMLIENYEQQLTQAVSELQSLEHQRDEWQQRQSSLTKEQGQINAQCQVEQNKLQQVELRKQQLSAEHAEITEQYQKEQHNLQNAREQWQALLQVMEQQALQRSHLQSERDHCQQVVQTSRDQANRAQTKVHEITTQWHVLQTQHQAAIQNQVRLEQLWQQAKEREQYLHLQQAELDAPHQALETQLQTLLSQQQTVEKRLQEKRIVMEEVDTLLRQIEKQRVDIDHEHSQKRSDLEQIRLQHQTIDVRRQTMVEQLNEIGFVLSDVENDLPEFATESSWEEQLTKVTNRIERLGAVNLAAVSEYAQQAERKNYLDQQHNDLTQALDTLRDAISKIDRETRAKFKEVYDLVNSHFQTLFPRIFGGGSASLELTSEELLETGVNVMARPPGKRNSTIHLLSGGEKALTAIALVFSIFQLNPAPFCMLDEVDAPLDDANVGRFCELVKEMSQTVQFIFISHNKLAIEMADHLTGVTMHEPGVSRLVAVDVEQAIAMAEKA